MLVQVEPVVHLPFLENDILAGVGFDHPRTTGPTDQFMVGQLVEVANGGEIHAFHVQIELLAEATCVEPPHPGTNPGHCDHTTHPRSTHNCETAGVQGQSGTFEAQGATMNEHLIVG